MITRIDGDYRSVTVRRQPNRIFHPHMLNVVCVGDRISVDPGSGVTLSLDGVGVRRVPGGSTYPVAERPGSHTLAKNLYDTVNDRFTSDFVRLSSDMRMKGGDAPLGFAIASLPLGTQRIPAGRHGLLVRLIGGTGPYETTVLGPDGLRRSTATGAEREILLPQADLEAGRYRIVVKDGAGASIGADFDVVAGKAPAAKAEDTFSDPEVRAAITAAELARADQAEALEAEEMLSSAPANGLDRETVYELIESYTAK